MRSTASKTKIKQMSPAKIAERRSAEQQRAVDNVSAIVGLPDAQRRHDVVEIVSVPQIGKAPRTTGKTLRKLTTIEKLHATGTLTRDEAEACGWYAEIKEIAWSGTYAQSSYEGTGSSRGGYAPDRHMARLASQQRARDDYALARVCLAEEDVAVFERVICHGMTIGPAAKAVWGDLGKSAAYVRANAALKRCAGILGAVRDNRPAHYGDVTERKKRLVEAVMRGDAAGKFGRDPPTPDHARGETRR